MKLTHLAASLAAASLFIGMTTAAAEEMKGNVGSAPAVLILVPTAFASNDNLANGCWARLYDEQNYNGSMLTMTGPVSVPETGEGILAGSELGRNLDSLVVGPNASLQVWDDEEYEGKTQTFAGGQRVADVGEKMGMYDNIRSISVTCSGSTPMAKSN